jgi:glutamate/tyrosine decarboxylase-like PLP-dependent enzyme
MDGFLEDSYRRIRQAAAEPARAPASANPGQAPTLPSQSALATARAALPKPADTSYLRPLGPQATLLHLLDTIAPALNGQNLSGRYFGFVTGSTLPIAEAADNIVSAWDQNVGVHLPSQTIATEVEDAALRMIISLLEVGDHSTWEGRVFTTGATASNILGLACGREAVVNARLPSDERDTSTVGELGLLRACKKAGIEEVQVLSSMAHSSTYKAASIVGLGRGSVKDLPYSSDEPWRLDLNAVEKELQREGVASIISVSAGEVNTSCFATTGIEDMRRLRQMADRYGAWIHVDGGTCQILVDRRADS